ncbi:hypothetical protein D0Y65_004072 [Glycine soja]|uniref:Uncharacterized protein n=1 Tax=Glycine soja TaxID=3848 RepID=A0A0B2QZF4_GLYSO|nr:hypothetical protein glysoja_043274 [Glycine soja]RZC25224.1 hypothetical protein D0Y65_004072 [Glycine soja]
MPSPVQPSHSPSAEGEKHKQLNKEIRGMLSAITHRVTDFHKPGNNNGATMKSELDEKSSNPSHGDEPEALSTFVNSNFQAINNSVMLGGSYQANDPGVHMDISDFSTAHEHHHQSHYHKEERHGKKGKKIEKKASKPKESSSSSSSSD